MKGRMSTERRKLLTGPLEMTLLAAPIDLLIPNEEGDRIAPDVSIDGLDKSIAGTDSDSDTIFIYLGHLGIGRPPSDTGVLNPLIP